MHSLTFHSKSPAPVILAIGQFDGVHLGHQAVFRAAAEDAQSLGGVADCLTFQPHVATLLNPGHAPLLLATPEQNRERMQACGIHNVHTLPFTRELANLKPEAFLARLKETVPGLAGIAVGENFTFGKGREGNLHTLPELARAAGIQARIVPHVIRDGAPVSSSRIRAAVREGDMPEAAALLGRAFSLTGTVERGRGVGRSIGFPTANVLPSLPIRPAPGIYAARLHLPDKTWPGGIFVPDPADPNQSHFGEVVEIHCPGLDQDLYHQFVEVSFTLRLRGHEVFADAAMATERIGRDIREALRVDSELRA